MKKIISIFAVLFLLSWGGTLLAGPVTLQLTSVSPSVTPVSVDGEATVAGVMNLLIDGEKFLGYCVDPADIDLYNHDYFPFYLIDIPNLDQYLEATWLFATYGSPSDAVLAGDVQMAIWTVMGMEVTLGLTDRAEQFALDAAAAVDKGWDATGGFMLAVSPDETAYFDNGVQGLPYLHS